MVAFPQVVNAITKDKTESCLTNWATTASFNTYPAGAITFSRLEAVTEVRLKIQFFWDMTPCPWVFPDVSKDLVPSSSVQSRLVPNNLWQTEEVQSTVYFFL
jgi:hypothetical protein